MVVLLAGWSWVALANSPLALVTTPSVSSTDLRAAVGLRVGLGGEGLGAQVGGEVRGAWVRQGWIDGWPVERGQAGSALLAGSVPLARRGSFRLDLRANLGARSLRATDTSGPFERSWAVLTEIGPRATLQLGPDWALGIGFDNLADFQVDPSFATDGLGQLLQAQLVRAAGPDWQVGLVGETGGLFGYDGDGAKFAARLGISLRYTPGASRDKLFL